MGILLLFGLFIYKYIRRKNYVRIQIGNQTGGGLSAVQNIPTAYTMLNKGPEHSLRRQFGSFLIPFLRNSNVYG